MAVPMEKYLTVVMKAASKAIYLDSENQLSEAYMQYLQCLSNITTQLLQQATQTGINAAASKSIRKFVQLGQQCMERISIILDKIGKTPPAPFPPTHYPISHQSTSKSALDGGTSPTIAPLSPGELLPPSNRHPGIGPMEMAYKQNQQLLNAYRSRKALMNQTAASNLSLTIQRRMAENLAIAKRREEGLAKKMQERQQRLEEQASRRFSVPTGLSKIEQEQRQIYKRILEYEQDTKWLLELRRKLEENPKDARLIHQLISLIFKCADHPLSQLLKDRPYKLCKRLNSVITDKTDLLDSVKVAINQTDDDVPNITELLSPDIKGSNSNPWIRKVEENKPQEPSHRELEAKSPNLELHSAEMDNVEDERTDINLSTSSSINFNRGLKDELNLDPIVNPEQHDLSSGDSEVEKVLEKTKATDNTPLHEKIDTDNPIDNTMLETTALDETQEELKTNLETAISQNQSFRKTLKDTKATISKITFKTVNKSVEEYEDEISDAIWGSDEEDTNSPQNNLAIDSNLSVNNSHSMDSTDVDDFSSARRSESVDSTESMDSSTLRRWRDLYSQPMDEADAASKLESMKTEAYLRHLKWISQDVHSYLEEIQVMFVVAYEQLDSPEGRDQCFASLEEPFFSTVWPHLLALCRLANLTNERGLAQVMSRYHTVSPKDVGVRPKLCLVLPPGVECQDYIPYDPAIKELQTITNFTSPLLKLECLVRVSKRVCQCVEEYYTQTDTLKKQPNIGADDLLPILTYVIIQSKVYQIVSECQALEEFIHEGYLMGEEGYCLTSLQTAIHYVVSLHHRLKKTQLTN